ncbi:hypothetical protein JW979_16105 [bacterium]|nr:hypothetical protein [candidate division CSSED10-310 bacterium]
MSNVDVMYFIKELSAKSAISIVVDTKINGKISGKLYHVSLEDGLKALLQANGFQVTKIKNSSCKIREMGMSNGDSQ